jgi:hypothetical protein
MKVRPKTLRCDAWKLPPDVAKVRAPLRRRVRPRSAHFSGGSAEIACDGTGRFTGNSYNWNDTAELTLGAQRVARN